MTSKTVEKSLSVLEFLARSGEACGVSDLSRELKMPKSNVFRLLDTLVSCGYLRRRPDTGRYELTFRLWELGNLAFSQKSLVEVAGPFLGRIVDEIGESAHLAVFDDGDSVFIDKRDGKQPIRGFTEIGSRAPAYCCATGKAALAFQPDAEIARSTKQLKKFTKTTVISVAALRRELEEIASRGYAVNRGEWYEDVWGVASPVLSGDGTVCATIGIWAPKHRIEGRVTAMGEAVRAVAADLSIALGCTPGSLRASSKQRGRK